MGKDMDPPLPSWTKAHVLLLVEKVELFFLEVKEVMQARAASLLKTEQKSKRRVRN